MSERVPVDAYPIVDGNHALRAGMALGVAMAAGLDVEALVDVEGNYTAAIEVRSDRLPPNVALRVIVE